MWEAILTQVLLPELARFLASRGPGQPFPTDAEILAHFNDVCDRVVVAGNAWLASKGRPPISTPGPAPAQG